MDTIELQEQLRFLEETPKRLSQLIKDLDDQSLRTKLSDDEFSVLEHICHLRDIEADGYEVRFARILAEDHPRLVDIDGSRLAVERRYNQQAMADAFRSFQEARARTVTSLARLSAADLARTGELEGVGTVSLAELVRMLREHDESHLDELSALQRRLYARRSEC